MNVPEGFLKKLVSPAGLIIVIAIVASFFAGFEGGKVRTARTAVPEGEASVVNKSSRAEDIDFGLFWDVWNTLKEEYATQPVSEEALFYGAVHGLVEGLDDPYSAFFTREEAEAFNAEIDGTFSGIGAEIDSVESYIVVVSPLKDSPAENAGLRAGDTILAVDGETTFELGVSEAVQLIRGEKGTEVVLTLVRDGTTEPFDLTIIRDDITINSVEWEIRDDGILVVSMYMFNQDTTRLFTEALQEALSKDIKGIVLDLQNNPGGLLSQAVSVAGFWTGNQTVVIEDMRGVENPLKSHGQALLKDIPTVVLVNGGSASASEIVAGALQDYGLAHVIGEQTYGKGTVQELMDLPGGAALKLTIAQWLTPNRRSIQDNGITPDELIEFTQDDLHATETPQFEAAIRYLKAR